MGDRAINSRVPYEYIPHRNKYWVEVSEGLLKINSQAASFSLLSRPCVQKDVIRASLLLWCAIHELRTG